MDAHWTPYAPNPAQPWNRERVEHLYRRFGFGATDAEISRDLDDGFDISIDRFLIPGNATSQDSLRKLHPRTEALARQAIDLNRIAKLKAAWINEMWHGDDPLGEQLTLMWHNHFATSFLKVQNCDAMWRQNQTLRRHARGNFRQLLSKMIVDEAMLIWLDGTSNRRRHPNENLARELLELFTLGVGHYTEKDVADAARALTGWRFDEGSSSFDPAEHDGGTKVILGKKAKHDVTSLSQLLLDQPETARRIAWRICNHFLSATPSPDAVSALARCLTDNDWDVSPAIEMLVRSRAFFSQDEIRTRIRPPVSLVVGGIRSFDLHVATKGSSAVSPEVAASWLAALGQDLFQPPGVSGWSGGRSWIGVSSMIDRAAFGKRLGEGKLTLDDTMRPELVALGTASEQLD